MNKYLSIDKAYRREENNLVSIYNNPKFYINRELSWIEFNKRVLHQCIRKSVPLLERLKFLGITASNLDEFLMVRFASILNKLKPESRDNTELSGLHPIDEYESILKEIIEFKRIQEGCFISLRKKLKKKNIHLSDYNKLSGKEQKQADDIFFQSIFPILTPVTFDTTKDFPLIHSKQLCMVVDIKDRVNLNSAIVSIIPLDSQLPRIYKLDSSNQDESRYITLEEIIFSHLNSIFVNKDIDYAGLIRMVREADMEINKDKDIYIVDRMREILYQREHSLPIFMDVSSDMPKQVLKLLIDMFGINKDHVYRVSTMIDLSVFAGMPIHDYVMEYDSFSPKYPAEIAGQRDLFTVIDNEDILLQHPYESFNPIIKFLEHAANDNDVVAIKQTLYRVSSEDSPIIKALCRAARKGKQVSVLLEIKARFDESRNISLVEKLKDAGCRIIYGIEEFKTHCKFIVIVRKHGDRLKTYSHIGTGNYNDKTAKIYTDISYMTSNTKVGKDLINIFNILAGFSDPRDKITKIFYSPYNIRSKFYEMIDREIYNAERGKEAAIILKLNSLSDFHVIRRLYIASEKGVKISILCRGICSMRPINKNISIRSIVGRYLEHSRIYYFYNDNSPKVFISSADLLTRNLDRRVEIMVPIKDKNVKSKLFGIIISYYRDTYNTYIMNKHGEYNLIADDTREFNVHEFFMDQAIKNYKPRNIKKINLKK